jgi:hypothetical protein
VQVRVLVGQDMKISPCGEADEMVLDGANLIEQSKGIQGDRDRPQLCLDALRNVR